MAETSILLRNATILVPSKGGSRITPLKAHSLLIQGNVIARIASHIDPPSDNTTIIDCTGKLVSPGFIDTHHHVWQTQLKGRHADHTLVEYMPTGNMQAFHYTPEDIFWGELGGLLEALSAGTTTIVDHAHMNYSTDHNISAIAATVSSGIRSIFCYTPTMKVAEWQPKISMDFNLLPDRVIKQVEELAASGPYGSGRVQIGLAFDALFLPKDIVVDLYTRCRQAGTKLITTHYVRGAVFGKHSLIDLMDSHNVLGNDILISHANNLSESDAEKLVAAGASISSTPETELQMGLGSPVCFQDNVSARSSLGIDCHSNNSASIVGQMRLGLQAERGRHNEKMIQSGKAPRRLHTSVQTVFQLGTIMGAKAIGMEDKLGSLEEGKLADVVIFDALSPGMVCAAEEDPVAAIVLHSSIADIDTVIVDGNIVKQGGTMNRIRVEKSGAPAGVKESVEWSDVARELLKSRDRINEAAAKHGELDLGKAVADMQEILSIEDGSLV